MTKLSKALATDESINEVLHHVHCNILSLDCESGDNYYFYYNLKVKKLFSFANCCCCC